MLYQIQSFSFPLSRVLMENRQLHETEVKIQLFHSVCPPMAPSNYAKWGKNKTLESHSIYSPGPTIHRGDARLAYLFRCRYVAIYFFFFLLHTPSSPLLENFLWGSVPHILGKNEYWLGSRWAWWCDSKTEEGSWRKGQLDGVSYRIKCGLNVKL